MPVILDSVDHDALLGAADANSLHPMLKPAPENWLVAVSTRVNNVRYDDAACVEPNWLVQGL